MLMHPQKVLNWMAVALIFLGAGGQLHAGSLLVIWDPIQDGQLAGYKIKYGTSSNSYSGVVDVGKVTSYVVPNLNQGTRYFVVVVGYDSNRVEGTASAEVSGLVLSVSGISSSSITANSAVVSWQTNKPGDSQVDYGPTTTYGSVTALDGSLVTSHSQKLTNLQPSTTYHFRVRSKDEGGATLVSGDFSFTTLSPPDTTPPKDVTNFTAIPGDSRVWLSWTNPTDSDFKGVMLRYRTDGTYPVSKTDGMLAVDRIEIAGAKDYFEHLNLTNGTTYYYSAFSYDTSQNYSSTARAQAMPVNLAIQSISPHRGIAGTAVVLTGTGFGTTQGNSTVSFNDVVAQVSSWRATSISVIAPSNATSGLVIVTVNGAQTNGVYFKVGNKLGPPRRLRLRR